MSVFEHESFDSHEIVHFHHDPDSGLKAIIAVHSSALGPGAGGCRLWNYDSSEAALKDVLRLSQGMSYKSAVAGLPLGGGKSVIIKPEGRFDRDALFRAFGRAVDSLGGAYVSAEDVGVSPADLSIAREHTPFVAGLEDGENASGDPSPVTAKGVYRGIRASVRHKLGQDDLKGIRVAVQGVGHVGMYLLGHLHKAGATLLVSDINQTALKQAEEKYGAVIVDPAEIHIADVDVYAPCALGATVNAHSLDQIKAPIIAGAANNQLATADLGAALRARDILYAPDYVINAGGIINGSREVHGRPYDALWVEGKLEDLEETLSQIFKISDDENRPTADIADDMARKVIADAKAAKKA